MSETAMIETTSNKATKLIIANDESGEDVVDGLFDDETDGRPTLNTFAARKRFISSCFDAGLFMANMSQLKAVLDLGPDSTKLYRFSLLIVLICLSLLLQIIFGVLMLVKWKLEKELEQNNGREGKTSIVRESRESGKLCCNTKINKSIDNIDIVSLSLVFASILINITITAFGLTSK